MEDKNNIEQAIFIAGLIKKYKEDSLTSEETIQLENWRNASPHQYALFERLTNDELLGETLLDLEKLDTGQHELRIISRVVPENQENLSGETLLQERIAGRMRPSRVFFDRVWLRAAVIILICTGVTFYYYQQKAGHGRQQPMTAGTTAMPAQAAQPGGDKAVLTLSDGTKVVLDSAGKGMIGRQGDMAILNESGRLSYQKAGSEISGQPGLGGSVSEGHAEGAPALNKITTPRGGQYQVVLADGSRVWLNAASTLSFPAAFTGREREVALEGEAYFEVVHGSGKTANMPFKVKVHTPSGKPVDVYVLGTSFNINAYNDEDYLRTTLVDGAVKLNKEGQQVLLHPGQQARVAGEAGAIQLETARLEEVLAWKNGEFLFDNTTIRTIMRQIARWYDVDIVYEPGKDFSDIQFSGSISRKREVAELLDILASDGRLKFRVKDKQILVQSSH